ncbi:ATP-dependent transcriptional regulator [Mycolicibacterium aurum]|uniref:ATP-dependent transcriptional regulator n=1 Tax=Mycolicibacterium aurum TaxID=1791 RepID=A0A448IIL5_MYCAU|nr:hypothetical protein [Mycolicibacterium aurum]VEG52107.1 ATP-dependent transcriptional regulator [Mycolicibacterium aurum]
MSTGAAIPANDLEVAAFGADPGMWPLPPAAVPRELWLRAVAAGGQGRYAGALADLDRLHRLPISDALSSLALSTRASFLRQLGWHDVARSWDGRAAAAAGSGEAGADALIGLAADALGVGRFAASQRALDLAGDVVAGAGSPRSAVRLAWVSAELAMFRGDGAGAVGHAGRGVHLATAFGSVRHSVKSRVVLAAALCSAGDLEAARGEAGAALSEAQRHGLVPLLWAAACLLADIGAEGLSAAQIRELRDESAETVVRWGGVWRPW